MVRLVRAASLAALALAVTAASAAGQEPVLIRVPAGVDPERAHPASEPVFGADVVRRLRERAEREGRPPPPVTRWVTVQAPSGDRAAEVATAFDARPGYEAEVAPRVAPPPAACRELPVASGYPRDLGDGESVPDLTVLQDARGLLEVPATADARGAGVDVIDVELEWDEGHQDLPAGLPDDPDDPDTRLKDDADDTDVRHGTAVLGIIGARDDGVGVTGLAPEAVLRPVSPYSGGVYAPAGALGALLGGPGAAGPGDVVLIELQAYSGGGTDVVGPVELSQAMRDAIGALVAAGVVVIEPAGNGDLAGADGSGRDLAALGVTPGSGGLIVGAGDRDGDPAARPNGNPVGNHGDRVDVQGLGEGVVTTGGGNLLDGGGSGRDYTHCFNGTSSAAATVAGAVASLQSSSIALTGRPRTPAEVGELLAATGTAQPPASATTTPIGLRPSIAAARERLVPPPPPVISGPGDGATVADPPTYSISAEPGAVISWSLGGPVTLSGTGGEPSLGAIDAEDGANDGVYRLTATATDSDGNVSAPRVRTFTLDNPDPAPPIVAPAAAPPAPPAPAPAPAPAPNPAPAPASAAAQTGVPAPGGRAVASALVERTAARAVAVSWNRRTGRLVLRLKGLAPRARARLGGRRLAVRRGRVVARRARPGAVTLLVSAPSARATRVRTVRYRLVLPARGRPRAVPVATRSTRPAVKKVRVLLDRDRGRVTFTLTGLAPRAVVRVDGKRVARSGGTARAGWTGARRAVLVVTAPSSKARRVTRVRYRVTLPASGRPVLRRV